jgi:hypothetical protein
MEAGVSSSLAPEEQHAYIVLETLGQQQRLRHVVTGEVADLPMGLQLWTLEQSDKGAYVYRLGEVEWAIKFLRMTLHNKEGRRFVVHGGCSTWLRDWLRESVPMFLRLPSLAVRGTPGVLKALKMEHPVDDCAMMWEVRYIHVFLGLGDRWQVGSRFIADGVARWRQHLSKHFGLGYLHLRGSASTVTKVPEDWMADACLHEVTASTLALVLLLGHWSCSKSEALATGAANLFMHFIKATMRDLRGLRLNETFRPQAPIVQVQCIS